MSITRFRLGMVERGQLKVESILEGLPIAISVTPRATKLVESDADDDDDEDGSGDEAVEIRDWQRVPPRDWTPSQAAQWVYTLGPRFAVYAPLFSSNMVTGSLLMGLVDENLLSIGVSNFKDRKQLLSQSDRLRLATEGGKRSGKNCFLKSVCYMYIIRTILQLYWLPYLYLAACPYCAVSSVNYLKDNSAADNAVVYVAIASFAGGVSPKLGFAKGDTMVFERQVTADWFKVKMSDGRVGLVPSNYVVKKDDASPARSPRKASVLSTQPAAVEQPPRRRSSTSALPAPSNARAPAAAPPASPDERRRLNVVAPQPAPALAAAAPPPQRDPLPSLPPPVEPPNLFNQLPAAPPAPKNTTPTIPKRMRVVHEFEGSGRKISLQAGDEVVVLDEVDANWWQVRTTDGRVGLAPTNYLQVMPPVMFRAISTFTGRAGQLSFVKGEELTLIERKNANWFEVVDAKGIRGLVPSNYVEEFDPDAVYDVMYRAIADFTGSGLKVSLKQGEEVQLIRRKSTDWFEVKKANGQRGLAPSNYLEEFVPVPKMFKAIAEYRGSGQKLPLRVGDKMTLIKRVTADWYEVEKQNGERGLVPSNYIEEFDAESTASEEHVRAIADYVGRGGQVSFSRGEIMVLLKKLSSDWYNVKKNTGEKGLAPSSYLEECVVVYCAIADYFGPAGQVSLSKGEEVNLISRKNNDWCEVKRSNGFIGLAPLSYLQLKIQPARSVKPPTVPAGMAPSSVPVGALPSAEERNRIPAAQWAEAHVLSWLRDQPDPIPNFMDAFRRNDINGSMLVTLNENDLEKIGVTSLRARREIFQAISALKGIGQYNAAPAPRTFAC
jgi:uncharacterized protein YgiM (DUF1202 family)